MHAKTFLVSLMATAASASVANLARPACGAPEPTAEDIANTQQLVQFESEARRAGNETFLQAFTVPTYFHVVASAQNAAGGWVTDQQISQQLAVINSDFAPFGISFNLIETTRTINPTWAQDSSEQAMKTALRKGGYDALNLYIMRSLGGALGYCYFPTNASPGSAAFIRDGCSVVASSLPGGSSTGFNLGKTATHEIGHWLNLYHTFQGSGCSEPGDFVADTPVQSTASSGCPIGRDSCPSLPGVDPIHNYMDYSNDACYEEFTAGQQTRMHSAYSTFRA